MAVFNWENMSQNNVAMGSREVYDGLLDYFPISEVKELMLTLSNENTVQFYIDRWGYQLIWIGSDHYTVA